MQWFRSKHGAPTHPKWLGVARKSGQPVAVVVAVVWALLDHASRQEDRGSVDGFDADEIAAYLNMDEADIEAVIAALYEKRWLLDGVIASWEEHQPLGEAATSTERVRAYRARQKTESEEVIHALPPPDVTDETLRNGLDTEKTQTQKKKGNGQASPDLDALFAIWWNEVPRKVSKGAAERAFKTAMKRTSFETLLNGMRSFTARCRAENTDPQFICHPSTWLNGKRWLDEDQISMLPPAEKGQLTDEGWRGRLLRWVDSGGKEWDMRDADDHPPWHPGCKAPQHLMDEIIHTT